MEFTLLAHYIKTPVNVNLCNHLKWNLPPPKPFRSNNKHNNDNCSSQASGSSQTYVKTSLQIVPVFNDAAVNCATENGHDAEKHESQHSGK